MQNRRQSRPRQGNTVAQQGPTQQPVPRLPHEHDESADSQPAAEASVKRVGKRAHDDLAQGQQDTGKSPEMDAAYDKLKR